MKNRIIIICFLCVGNLYSFAQGGNRRAKIPSKIEIDKSVIEVIYNHDVYDEDLDEHKYDKVIVQIGNNKIQSNNYSSYQKDSIIYSLKTNEISQSFYDNLCNTYNNWLDLLTSVCIDLKEKQIEVGSRLPLTGNYKYKEEYRPIKWKVSDEFTDVLGHKCRKAVCSYRGVEWTVWYAPDIKYSYGPWRLNGLPGMILKAESGNGSHKFEAIGLRKKSTPIIYDQQLSTGKLIERKQYLDMDKDAKLNGVKGYWESYLEDPANRPKPAIKHFTYAPYEME